MSREKRGLSRLKVVVMSCGENELICREAWFVLSY